MTAPDYKFNDDRLKAYLDYLQYTIDPMTSEINGISMSVNMHSSFNGATTLYMNALETELPRDSALQEKLSRTRVDLSLFDEARVTVHVKSASDSICRVQYSLDMGATWDYLDGIGAPSAQLTGATPWTVITDGWVTLDALAKDDVMLRLVGNEITGGPNPVVGNVSLELRTLWSFEDPVMTYDERIQYLSDNQLPPFD